MQFSEGNKYAEKISEQEAIDFGNAVISILENEKKVRSIESASVKAGKYETYFWYCAEKFPDVFEPIKRKAKSLAKAKLIEQGLDNEVNPTMAIFILKNNHGMKDKTETDLNAKVGITKISVVDVDGTEI